MAPRKSSIYAGVMAFRDFCKTLNTLNGGARLEIGALASAFQIGALVCDRRDPDRGRDPWHHFGRAWRSGKIYFLIADTN